MLRTVIICPDKELGDRLEGALHSTRRVGVARRLHSYPTLSDLTRMLRATAPEVVFLSVEARQTALEMAGKIEEESPGTQLVAINRSCDSAILLETMRVGIREFLAPPFDTEALDDSLSRMEAALEQRPVSQSTTDNVFAFLPAKAGCGATTIAVNTALAMAEMGKRTLLIDLDLNCGLAGFMLLLRGQYSILDAAENALEMDENLWSRIVSKVEGLDVLAAGKLSPGFRIETTQIRHILAFARRNYEAICVDLSGMMEKYSLDVLHEAQKVFLVCTGELPALHLAREKLAFLRRQEVDDRVKILLNRAQRRNQITLSEMEQLFGSPVHMAFPNDYAGVHKALTAGKPVNTKSELGLKYRELAEALLEQKTASGEKKRGLFDVILGRKPEVESLAEGGNRQAHYRLETLSRLASAAVSCGTSGASVE